MNPKRKKTQDYILEKLKPLDKANVTIKRYTEMFAKMSDEEFDQFMQDLRSGKEVLYVYFANMKNKISVAECRDYATALGIKLFERIRMWDETTESYYYTPHKYCTLALPIRRQSQFVDHKLSVPEGDSKIDMLSGQVVKPDKGAGISQVEIQTLHARNLPAVITELLKYRGGDVVAMGEFKRELEEQGRTTLGRDTGSIARSVVTMNNMLIGMHIESNIAGDGM